MFKLLRTKDKEKIWKQMEKETAYRRAKIMADLSQKTMK